MVFTVKSKWIAYTGISISAALITAYMLWPVILGVNFVTYDTFSNIWFVNYYKDFFSKYETFPWVFNVIGTIKLNPFPLFYGDMVYRISSLISLCFGKTAEFGLFSFIFCITFILSFCYIFIFVKIFKDYICTMYNIYSMSIAFVIIAANYQLTNLWARGALMEYCAFSCLLICLSIIVMYILDNNKTIFYFACFSLFYSLLINCHPITAMLGSIFLVPIVAVALYRFIKNQHIKYRFLIFSLFLVLFFMSSLHFLILFFSVKNYMPIALENIYHLPYIDNLISRLSIVPIDLRIFEDYENISTPGLTGQVNIILFFLIFYLILKSKKIYLYIEFVLFLFLFLFLIFISVYQQDFINIKFIQFKYRIVNYINFIEILFFMILVIQHKISIIKSKIIYLFVAFTMIGNTIFYLQLIPYDDHFVKRERIDEIKSDKYFYEIYGMNSFSTDLYYEPIERPDRCIDFDMIKNNNWEFYADITADKQNFCAHIDVASFIWNKIDVFNSNRLIKNYKIASAHTIWIGGLYLIFDSIGEYKVVAKFSPPLIYKIFRLIYPWSFIIVILIIMIDMTYHKVYNLVR